jgi:hypothetical protein
MSIGWRISDQSRARPANFGSWTILAFALRPQSMAPVTQWRSKSPYIVRVQRHPVLEDHWVLEFPSGATFSAPVRFDDDENPIFSLPRAELRNHIALREQKAREMDFRRCSNLSKVRFQARRS